MDMFDKLILTMISDQLEMAIYNIESEFNLQRILGEDRTDKINNALVEARRLQGKLHNELNKIEEVNTNEIK